MAVKLKMIFLQTGSRCIRVVSVKKNIAMSVVVAAEQSARSAALPVILTTTRCMLRQPKELEIDLNDGLRPMIKSAIEFGIFSFPSF